MSAKIFNAIAEELNISPMTVRRALNSPLKDTRPSIVRRYQRIRELANELNYRPNSAAKAMASGRFGAAAIVMSAYAERSHLCQGMLRGVYDALIKNEMQLSMAILRDEQLTDESFIPHILRLQSCDGMLVNYNEKVPPRMQALINRYEIPVIWINYHKKHNCVYPNDRLAGQRCTEHLLQLGHRRILYADLHHGTVSTVAHYSAIDRMRGYEAAMHNAGLEPVLMQKEHYSGSRVDRGRQRRKAITRTLNGLNRPTAVVAYSDAVARLVYVAAREGGLTVPEDVSLVTIDGGTLTDFGEKFTNFDLRWNAVGREAVRMLLQRIECPSTQLTSVSIDGHLRIADTCRPILSSDRY